MTLKELIDGYITGLLGKNNIKAIGLLLNRGQSIKDCLNFFFEACPLNVVYLLLEVPNKKPYIHFFTVLNTFIFTFTMANWEFLQMPSVQTNLLQMPQTDPGHVEDNHVPDSDDKISEQEMSIELKYQLEIQKESSTTTLINLLHR